MVDYIVKLSFCYPPYHLQSGDEFLMEKRYSIGDHHHDLRDSNAIDF